MQKEFESLKFVNTFLNEEEKVDLDKNLAKEGQVYIAVNINFYDSVEAILNRCEDKTDIPLSEYNSNQLSINNRILINLFYSINKSTLI
jgi:hypothetical protein